MDPTNRNTALASAMVEELARCGLRRAALSPGSRSTPLALALWRNPAIDVTVLVDERCAGFFALGAAQAEGRPAAVLCTSGSAAANLHPAVVEAGEAAVPLIVLTADRPPELRGIGAGQTIDQIGLYGTAVRWFCEVGTHDADDPGLLHFRSVACRAYAAAGAPRPGPVHLNVAWREPLAPTLAGGEVTATSPLALDGRGDRPLTAVASGPPPPDEALLDELADRVAAAPRGLVVAGRQADPALARPAAELARAAGYPVLAEPTSQLRLGAHDRELVIWAYDAVAHARPPELEPQLVVRLGDMPTSKALRQWIASLDGLRQVVVDPGFGWNEPSLRAETMVRADPAAFATGIAKRLDGPGEAALDWAGRWRDAGRTAADAIEAELDELDEPTEPGIHAALGRLYADGDLVYTASSMPIRDQESFLAAGAAEVRFLCNRGANGIDGLISSALGAARASGSPTWVLVGDLGLFHDMNALAALPGIETPVRIVVLDNGGGGIFEFLPQADAMDREEFEALLGTPLALEAGRIAALHGIEHRRIEAIDELESLAAADRVLAEVRVDRRANVELHRRLRERATAALEGAADRP